MGLFHGYTDGTFPPFFILALRFIYIILPPSVFSYRKPLGGIFLSSKLKMEVM